MGWKPADGSDLSASLDAHGGKAAARVVRRDGKGHARLEHDPASTPAVWGTCTASAWVKGPAGDTAKIRLREYRGGSRVGSASTEVRLTGGWQRLAVDLSDTDGGTLNLEVYLSGAAPGQALLIDDVSERCR